jgi:hypothetical protein
MFENSRDNAGLDGKINRKVRCLDGSSFLNNSIDRSDRKPLRKRYSFIGLCVGGILGVLANAAIDTSVQAAPLNQWANSVLDFSTQYGTGTGNYTAAKALGAANVLSYGDNIQSWVPSTQNGNNEFIALGFRTPVYASGITIRENWGNGFVYKVDLLGTDNVWRTIWTGADPSQPGNVVNFTLSWAPTPYLVKGAKIYTTTNHNSGTWEEIDAVQLRGFTAASDRNPGNTLSTATNMGILNGKSSYGDSVSATDLKDVFSFTVNRSGPLQVVLNGLTDNADVRLIKDANNNGQVDAGEVIGSSVKIGTAAELINISNLAVGRYFVEVYSVGNASTNYNLSLATPLNQWASSVIAFSSQYSTGGWSAAQTLHQPNTSIYGDVSSSWASNGANIGNQFVAVGYDKPVYATGVTIRETWNNGFVYKVDLLGTDNVWRTIWTGTDPSLPGTPVNFKLSWARTSYLVKGVRVNVNTNRNSSWEEIDAIELTGYQP